MGGRWTMAEPRRYAPSSRPPAGRSSARLSSPSSALQVDIDGRVVDDIALQYGDEMLGDSGLVEPLPSSRDFDALAQASRLQLDKHEEVLIRVNA